MDFLLQLWNSSKGFVIGFVVRWLLVIGGTVFANAGISEDKLTELVGGVLAILVSIVISLLQHKKAVETPA